MMAVAPPVGLGPGGRALWRAITNDHPSLDPAQLVQLTEACRAKDRLDKLDATLRGEPDVWVKLYPDPNSDGSVYELRVTNALVSANATANLMKQLLAAMRLPDSQGARPQQRGGARGSYGAQTPGGKDSGTVSSIDRARARKSG